MSKRNDECVCGERERERERRERERERERDKKYCQVGRWVASLGPARIASLCLMTIGLSMTVRYCGHHCTQLRLGVFSPVGRDGRPPTLIRDGSENGERETERHREKGTQEKLYIK